MGALGEGSAAATTALALGLSLALVLDLGGPSGRGGRLSTTASSTQPASDLAEEMEAQVAAGLPGVALAIERSAEPARRTTAGVAAAHARAVFELGNAPEALATVRMATRICDVTSHCTAYERAQLRRLELVFDAVVAAGIVDVREESARASEAVRHLVRPAGFTANGR